MSLELLKEKRIGLVLSGGGLRGIAHIGVIEALKEYDINVDIISGTSIGALVGALSATNMPPDEMLEVFRSVSIFSFRNYTYKKPGLLNTTRFQHYLEENFEEDSFEHLQRELVVNATDMLNGRHKIFREGDLFKPLLSSVAYPGLFSPVEINGKFYSDGGITNNFPIEPIQWECDFLIGSYVNPLRKIEKSKLKNSFSMIERVLQISMYNMEVDSFHLSDIFIMPSQLSKFPLFSLKYIDKAYEMGYSEAKKQIELYLERQEKLYEEQPANIKD